MTYKQSLILSFLIATVLILAIFRVLRFHQDIGAGQGALPSPFSHSEPPFLVPDSPSQSSLGNPSQVNRYISSQNRSFN